MKNLILSTILIFVSCFSFAQSSGNFNYPNRKCTITEDKDGKFNSMSFIGENVQNKFLIDSIPMQKASDISHNQKHEKNRVDHHLTIHFDKNMTMGGDIIIASDLVSFSMYDVSWSEDGFSCEVDMPEDSYEICASCNDWAGSQDYSFIIIHNLNFINDIDTSLSFDIMANHKIFLHCNDENGNLLLPNDTMIFEKNTTVSIDFPDECSWNSTTYQFNTPPNGYIKISGIDKNAGYNLLLNELAVRKGKLYMADLGQVTGVTGDTILQNEPSEFIKMNMIMHAQPFTCCNYLTFGYGIRNHVGAGWSGLLNTNYPLNDKDTLSTFLANRLHENSYIEAFIVNVELWDSIPDFQPHNNKYIATDPFFLNNNDSIVFARYHQLTPAQYCINGNSNIDLGNTAPGYYCFLANNMMAPNSIFPYLNIPFGGIMEQRETDNNFAFYEIKKDGTTIVTDTLYNFTEPYVVTELGPYSFSLSNTNYKILDKQGLAVMDANFDLSNTNDANPPTLEAFRIIDSDGRVNNSFYNTEQGTLLFSAFDWDMITSKLIAPTEVRTYYKKFDETDWTELMVTGHPNWFDSITYGNFYTCELGEAFAQFNTPDYLDIKIVLSDFVGNTNTYTWHPVAYIDNNVGIPQVVSNKRETLRVYPNPVNDNSIVSFSLQQNTNVKLSVYNMNGQLINTLLDKMMMKGEHQFSWTMTSRSGKKPDSGIYLLKLETGNTVETSKVVVN
jgi:hypothetical protein